MFHFLGFLFIIIIAILVIGLSIISTVIRSIFGLRQRNSYGQQAHRPTSTQANGEGIQPEEGTLHPKRKKLFSKDEGEYVDFEEVKE